MKKTIKEPPFRKLMRKHKVPLRKIAMDMGILTQDVQQVVNRVSLHNTRAGTVKKYADYFGVTIENVLKNKV